MSKPKPLMVDRDGIPWWNFCFEYDWDGGKYAFDIPARSEQEAHDRLKRLPMARYMGQADGRPVALSRGGWLIPFVCWYRNMLRRAFP